MEHFFRKVFFSKVQAQGVSTGLGVHSKTLVCRGLRVGLSGIESAILNREPGDSESCYYQKYPQYCWEFHDNSSERPSPEPILKKRRPQLYWGGENSGNALKASNALNYRVWGIPAVLSREIPGNALRAFPGSFRKFSGISSGKSQPYWGHGPSERV